LVTSSAEIDSPAHAYDEAQDKLSPQLDCGKGQPYIVISDVHLGEDRCCKEEFREFLEWLCESKSADAKSTLKVRLCKTTEDETEENANDKRPLDEIDYPGTLILLGDILELWAPQDNKRTNVIIDSLSVFGKLIDLRCCKLYVLGNHDMSVFGWDAFETDGAFTSSANIPMPFNFECKNQCHFTTFPHYYPCTEGLKHALFLSLIKQPTAKAPKKKTTYLFMHGQQFDPSFRSAGKSTRIVPLITGLASTFDAFPALGPLCFALSLVAVGYNVGIGADLASTLFSSPALNITGIALNPLWWLVVNATRIPFIIPLSWLALGIFAYPGFSWFITKQMKRVWDVWQQLITDIQRSPYRTVSSWPYLMHARSKMRYVAYSDEDYDRIISCIRKSECIELEKDALDELRTSNKMIVVSGHTHLPGLSRDFKSDNLDWQFVNTGSWLKPKKRAQGMLLKGSPDARDEGGGPRYNTFVYINEDGPRLFKWIGGETDPKAVEIPPDDTSQATAT
jgi:UDP-2,3-diacylglucosamine pyrophosphatase LpxH